jgi:hypothetical protein
MSAESTQLIPIEEPRGNATARSEHLYLALGDRLAALTADIDFDVIYDEPPMVPPTVLALVTVLQFFENLGDTDAAASVATRRDWQYALHLPPGRSFDPLLLLEFRDRALASATGLELLDRLLTRLRRIGFPVAMRANELVAAVRDGNRLLLAWRTVAAVVTAAAVASPDWLATILSAPRRQAYAAGPPPPPRRAAAREDLAREIGVDGFRLLDAADHDQRGGQLPEIALLRHIWRWQYERHADGLRWRLGRRGLIPVPPASDSEVAGCWRELFLVRRG